METGARTFDRPGEPARQPHIVVVGGGIAGLAAAHALVTHGGALMITLLEAGPRLGGKLRLGEVADQPVDLGAEAILNRRPEGVALAKAVGLSDSVVYPMTTTAGVWSGGAVRRLPRTVMGVPADLDDLRDSGIVGRLAIQRARLERVMRRIDVTADVGIGRLVAHRLGSEIRDRLVEPLLGGVYAGRADELSLFATVPQLVAPIAEHGSLLPAAAAVANPSTTRSPDDMATPVPVFAGIDGGVGRLAEATEGAVRSAGVVVRPGMTVRELSRTATGFQLVAGPTIAPEIIDADAVVLATPATATARLLRAAAPKAAIELSRIEYASMALVTLAIEASEQAAQLEGSGFLVPPVDGRDIKAATFSSRKWGWHGDDVVLVRCSLGRLGDERQLQHDDTELVSSALLDLREAVDLPGRLVDATVTRWGGALPQYTIGHLDRVAAAKEAVAEVPGLALCGAAYDGVGIPACIASGIDAATQVVERLPGRDTMQP